MPPAPCPHERDCPGCPLIGKAYPEQLESKHQLVREALARLDELGSIQIEPVLGAHPTLAYRTRAKLIVDRQGAVGLYGREGDHQVVDLPGCLVLRPAVAETVAAIRRLLAAGQLGLVPGAQLVAIDVREVISQDRLGILLTLVINQERPASQEALEKAATLVRQQAPAVTAVACNMRQAQSPQVLGPNTRVVVGPLAVFDTIGQVAHEATFGAFTQVHRAQTLRLHDLIAEAIERHLPQGLSEARVLELYGGSGAIGLHLVRAGAHVDMVDSFAPAVASAQIAARLQGWRERFDAFAGDVAVVAPMLAQDRSYNVVVVDPPRRGLAPQVRAAIAQVHPALVVYVSCDPQTLARDLMHLRLHGLAASTLQPIDMMPQTEQVECLAVLQPGPRPAPAVLFADAEAIVVSKAAYEAAGRAGSDWQLLSPRDELVSGACLLVRPAARERWRRMLLDGQVKWLCLAGCKGIVNSKGTLRQTLQGRTVKARYRRVAVVAGHSLVRLTTDAADPAQLRVLLARIGHAVWGDTQYGDAPTARYFAERHALDRPFLHVLGLQMEQPAIRVTAALPGDLALVLQRMGGEPARL